MTIRFEYHILNINSYSINLDTAIEDTEKYLNEAGEFGWEIVTVNYPIFYFKRIIQETVSESSIIEEVSK